MKPRALNYYAWKTSDKTTQQDKTHSFYDYARQRSDKKNPIRRWNPEL